MIEIILLEKIDILIQFISILNNNENESEYIEKKFYETLVVINYECGRKLFCEYKINQRNPIGY